jgi:hypothetical protein
MEARQSSVALADRRTNGVHDDRVPHELLLRLSVAFEDHEPPGELRSRHLDAVEIRLGESPNVASRRHD